jgi:hypothetical protein
MVDGVLAGRQWWEAKEVNVDGLQNKMKTKYNNFSEHIKILDSQKSNRKRHHSEHKQSEKRENKNILLAWGGIAQSTELKSHEYQNACAPSP